MVIKSSCLSNFTLWRWRKNMNPEQHLQGQVEIRNAGDKPDVTHSNVSKSQVGDVS